jgi:molybdopterin-guanine dinucleotide biosynthesis protein A
MKQTDRALVLARGLGSRMRNDEPGVHLTADQQRAADAGLKALMPIEGRPFLDYVLGSLA